MTATETAKHSPLPTPTALAALVSRVTETMIGMSFSVSPSADDILPWRKDPSWRTVLLPIGGARPVTVAIAADEATGKAIGGRMFSCPDNEVDEEMLLDTLRELANIIAGQVKSAMSLDQALGLPKVVAPGTAVEGLWRSAVLQPDHGREQLFWVAITDR